LNHNLLESIDKRSILETSGIMVNAYSFFVKWSMHILLIKEEIKTQLIYH